MNFEDLRCGAEDNLLWMLEVMDAFMLVWQKTKTLTKCTSNSNRIKVLIKTNKKKVKEKGEGGKDVIDLQWITGVDMIIIKEFNSFAMYANVAYSLKHWDELIDFIIPFFFIHHTNTCRIPEEKFILLE